MSEPLGIKHPILPSLPLGNKPQSLSSFSSFFAKQAINNYPSETSTFNQINTKILTKASTLKKIEFKQQLNDPVSLASLQPLSKVAFLSPFQELVSRLNPPQPETNFFPSPDLKVPQNLEQENSHFIFTTNGLKLENSPQKSTHSVNFLEKQADSNYPEYSPNISSQNSMPVTNPQIIIQELTEKAYQKIVHRLETKRHRQNSASSRLPW